MRRRWMQWVPKCPQKFEQCKVKSRLMLFSLLFLWSSVSWTGISLDWSQGDSALQPVSVCPLDNGQTHHNKQPRELMLLEFLVHLQFVYLRMRLHFLIKSTRAIPLGWLNLIQHRRCLAILNPSTQMWADNHIPVHLMGPRSYLLLVKIKDQNNRD